MPVAYDMARRSRKKPYQKYNSAFQAIPIDGGVNLGALANNAAIVGNLTTFTDDFWGQSADLSWTTSNATVGEGPLLVGLCSSDLTAAQVAEAILATPDSRSDIVAREQARRPVRRVGKFTVLNTHEVLADGKNIRTPVKMYFAEATQMNIFVFNASGSTLTTANFVHAYGMLYGEWK